MVALCVFYIHVVAACAVFTVRWQEEGPGEGLLGVFFMGLLFFVGWSMSSFLVKLVMAEEGFGPALDRDAVSLLLLTIVEGIFYRFSFRGGADPRRILSGRGPIEGGS
ncbi:MAG: hypothetical protein WB626_08975 [Bacteroidota bacterium]